MKTLPFLLFLLCLNLTKVLWANIESYFKQVGDKDEAVHSIKNVDFIYMINLDERPQKYARSVKTLMPYGINPFRFSAVNGWHLSFEAIDDLGVRYQKGSPHGPIASVFRHVNGQEYPSFEIMQEEGVAYYCHSMSRGAIGCILSHLSVLQDAYDSGYHTIWVMEDDIRVISDPLEISSLISTLDVLAPNWDVLFTDNETKGSDGNRVYCGGIRPRPNFPYQSLSHYCQRFYVNEDIIKLGLRFGSYSMIVRRSGMKKLLDYFKTYKIFFPYDMEYFFPEGINLYSCIRDIVTTIAGGISDNGNPNYREQ
ncbi:MAG TPA: glycosyltransferase family 25 protein [Rhabdochlamydiaceae bacterium]|jgi:GR25 family glycosyltransferase involved in LPS biosynthesis